MITFLERGTSSGAYKGWETRRRGYPHAVSGRAARKIGRERLGYRYAKLPRGVRTAVSAKLLTKTGRTKSERQIEAILKQSGLLKQAKMGLGQGLETKSGKVKYTLMSNDGKHIYTGPTLGMRQKLMSWHKMIGEPLPSGFENWKPEDIEPLFLYWNKKTGGRRVVDRKIAAYTKPIKRRPGQ